MQRKGVSIIDQFESTSKEHMNWENKKELRDLKKCLTERDNEIVSLKLRVERIKHNLNTAYEGRYINEKKQ